MVILDLDNSHGRTGSIHGPHKAVDGAGSMPCVRGRHTHSSAADRRL